MFGNLIQELLDLKDRAALFTFVEDPEVEPTNNLVERLQRGAARDRNTGRTNKTPAGARQRSVILSVLESLRACLQEFTFSSVVAEVTRWMKDGVSLFARQKETFALDSS